MKQINDWLKEFEENHQSKVNKTIHVFSIPLIYWSIIAMLWSIPIPHFLLEANLNWAYIALMGALGYYMFLSTSLAIGMLAFCYIILFLTETIEENYSCSLWQIALLVFAVSLVCQFIGHRLENKKLNLSRIMAHIYLGPLWLLSHIYRVLGIKI